MKEPELQDWACRLLEDQLMRLAELRNANPRDPGFKLWRQTTLTVVQRVWPGNLQRSERFRRIPFTAPSAKPNRAQVREHFERGCSEATSYLRGLIVEIQDGGLDPNRGASKPTEAPAQSESQRVTASLAAPLPGESDPRATTKPSPPLVGMTEPAVAPPPIPGFQSSSLSASFGTPGEAVKAAPRAEPPPPPIAKTPPAPSAAPSPAEGPRRAASGRAAKVPRKGDRRALKEMLGFMDESPAASRRQVSDPKAPEPPALFARPESQEEIASAIDAWPPVEPLSSAGVEPLYHEESSEEDSFDPPPPPPQAPPRQLPMTEPPIAEAVPEPAFVLPDSADEPKMGADPAELLRAAAAFSARTQVTSFAPTSKTAFASPVAAALGALAGEITSLGVPEGKRAAARAALTDLARQIEEHTATWETLRDAFSLVLDYPPLARRVIPLLVPFLDLP